MAGSKGREEGAGQQHKQHTEDRMVAGGFALLLIVGGLLTFLLFGQGIATLAVGVILVAAGLLLLLYKGLELLEAWLKRG